MSKTGAGLVQWCKDIIAGGNYVYWYGTYCNACTTSKLASKKKQYSSHYTSSRMDTYRKHIAQGKWCTDCVGLIKGYYWELDGVIKYGRNDLPDVSAKGMYKSCKLKGKISEGLPEIPGLLIFNTSLSHVAVYIGGGRLIEARNFKYGLQENAMSARDFTLWGLCPSIEYTAEDIRAAGGKVDEDATPAKPSTSTDKPETENKKTETNKKKEENALPTIRKGSEGLAVKVCQRMLLAAGCKLERYGVDGDCGSETVKAIKAFQTTHNLTVDGICGPLTWAALAG